MPSAGVNTAVLPGLVSLATAVETCADKDKLTKREWQHLQWRQERLGKKKKKKAQVPLHEVQKAVKHIAAWKAAFSSHQRGDVHVSVQNKVCRK